MLNTKPSQAPAAGPYRAAPTTMGISVREMEKGPKRINDPSSCSTMTMAVNTATPVRVRVSMGFFSIFKSSLLLLRSRRMQRNLREVLYTVCGLPSRKIAGGGDGRGKPLPYKR